MEKKGEGRKGRKRGEGGRRRGEGEREWRELMTRGEKGGKRRKRVRRRCKALNGS